MSLTIISVDLQDNGFFSIKWSNGREVYNTVLKYYNTGNGAPYKVHVGQFMPYPLYKEARERIQKKDFDNKDHRRITSSSQLRHSV